MIQSIELLKSLRFIGPHTGLKWSSVLVLGGKVWSFGVGRGRLMLKENASDCKLAVDLGLWFGYKWVSVFGGN